MGRKQSSGFRRTFKGGVKSREQARTDDCSCVHFVPGRMYLGKFQCVLCGGLRDMSIHHIRGFNSKRQSPARRLS